MELILTKDMDMIQLARKYEECEKFLSTIRQEMKKRMEDLRRENYMLWLKSDPSRISLAEWISNNEVKITGMTSRSYQSEMNNRKQGGGEPTIVRLELEKEYLELRGYIGKPLCWYLTGGKFIAELEGSPKKGEYVIPVDKLCHFASSWMGKLLNQMTLPLILRSIAVFIAIQGDNPAYEGGDSKKRKLTDDTWTRSELSINNARGGLDLGIGSEPQYVLVQHCLVKFGMIRADDIYD